MTLTFGFNLDGVGMNLNAKYLGQRLLSSKFIVRIHRQTHTHTHIVPIALPAPLKRPVKFVTSRIYYC